MSTFAFILLAWPFYLAVHGRLSDYVTLAKPSQSRASPAGASDNGGDASNSSTPSASDISQGLSILQSLGQTESKS